MVIKILGIARLFQCCLWIGITLHLWGGNLYNFKIIMIGGGVPSERKFSIELAKRYQSLILVLEHRYYGSSLPLGVESLQLQNLKYLNVHQALDDLAYFLNWIKKSKQFGVTDKIPWYYEIKMKVHRWWFISRCPFSLV